jgi:hypothetical protein
VEVVVMLTLGRMPEAVGHAVQRLIEESRPEPPESDKRCNGLFLSGGPGGCSYLDTEGEVWLSFFDGSIEQLPDGPKKVAVVADAAGRIPALAAWLPIRPAGATDCQPCHGSGQLAPPLDKLQCPVCYGLGWVLPDR